MYTHIPKCAEFQPKGESPVVVLGFLHQEPLDPVRQAKERLGCSKCAGSPGCGDAMSSKCPDGGKG